MKNLCKKYNINPKSWLLFGKLICSSIKKSNNKEVNICLEALKDLILNGDIPDIRTAKKNEI